MKKIFQWNISTQYVRRWGISTVTHMCFVCVFVRLLWNSSAAAARLTERNIRLLYQYHTQAVRILLQLVNIYSYTLLRFLSLNILLKRRSRTVEQSNSRTLSAGFMRTFDFNLHIMRSNILAFNFALRVPTSKFQAKTWMGTCATQTVRYKFHAPSRHHHNQKTEYKYGCPIKLEHLE